MVVSGNKLFFAAISLIIAAGLVFYWIRPIQSKQMQTSGFTESNLQNSDIGNLQATSPQKFETLSTTEQPATLPSNPQISEETITAPVIPAEIKQLNRDIANLVEQYDPESLTELDCQIIREQITIMHSASSVARSRGFGICLDCPDYQHMKKMSLYELKKLSELGDFEALHLYAEKLALNPDKRLEAVKPYFEAAILGSVTALQRLQALYTVQRKSIPEEDEDALAFNDLMRVSFDQLGQFRQGQPSVADDLPDDPKNVLQWSLRFYKRRIVKERQQRGLPPVENYPITDIPVAIKTRCSALMSDVRPQ